MLSIVLGVVCILTSSGLYVSLKKNLELMGRLEDVEDAVDETLKVLDDQYQKIDAKTKIEIFSDEPVVKDLVRDIVDAKMSLHKIAVILDMSIAREEQEAETNEK